LIGTAISGGALERRRGEAAEQYGPARIALEVERVASDFYLPAPEGEGRSLGREELKRLIVERNPFVFFSHELCARYFTYMDKKSGAHFILFDDLSSIRQKLLLAEQLGIREAFLLYPEVKDFLKELI
jgi:spore germination protein YaaH